MEGLSYESMHAFASNWLGKLILLAVLSLPLWHAAHRIFHALHDLGIHGHRLAYRLATYGSAALGSVVAVVLLLSI
jgi:fumarate reductase subunit D